MPYAGATSQAACDSCTAGTGTRARGCQASGQNMTPTQPQQLGRSGQQAGGSARSAAEHHTTPGGSICLRCWTTRMRPALLLPSQHTVCRHHLLGPAQYSTQGLLLLPLLPPLLPCITHVASWRVLSAAGPAPPPPGGHVGGPRSALLAGRAHWPQTADSRHTAGCPPAACPLWG